MNIEKLKELEDSFFEYYPNGFLDEKLVKVGKIFNTPRFTKMAIDSFEIKNFSDIESICQDFFNILLKSPLISFYEGSTLRNALKSFTNYEKDMLSIYLQDILYSGYKNSFDDFLELLASKNIAKWQIVTLIPYYFAPNNNYFLKPTTTKNIIKYFELENLKYNPKPSLEFYLNYTKQLENMKKHLRKELRDDNARFTGFLRMALDS